MRKIGILINCAACLLLFYLTGCASKANIIYQYASGECNYLKNIDQVAESEEIALDLMYTELTILGGNTLFYGENVIEYEEIREIEQTHYIAEDGQHIIGHPVIIGSRVPVGESKYKGIALYCKG